MTRKKRDYFRAINPDSVYNSILVAKFINKIMKSGKKSVAEKIVYLSLKKLSEKAAMDPLSAFEKVIKNASPIMEVKSRRVGGSTYQVPVEIAPDRSVALAMKWIIDNSRSKSGKSMIEQLSGELIDTFNKAGSSMKKREDTHKMAESNKAFAHFRW
jgi:small subunit ribosomal protein S7